MCFKDKQFDNIFKIFMPSGTEDGRYFARQLKCPGIYLAASVVSPEGEELIKDYVDEVYVGRKDAAAFAEIISKGEFDLILDATHPYAAIVGKELRKAAEMTGKEYLRYERPASSKPQKGIETVADIKEAARLCLKYENEGFNAGRPVFLSTGSKELCEFTKIFPAEKTAARILDSEKSHQSAREAGLKDEMLIMARGPFDRQANLEHFKKFNARILLTKDSGKAGGYAAKVESALELGMKVILIKRPESEISEAAAFVYDDKKELRDYIKHKAELKLAN